MAAHRVCACGAPDPSGRYESQAGPFQCEPCAAATLAIVLHLAVALRRARCDREADLLARVCDAEAS